MLFEVKYKDGSIYKQNEEDISISDNTRSCFYDVDQENVSEFKLIGENEYKVSLEDGHFEINGVPFKFHEESIKNFRLVFFRRHTHNFNVDYEELSHSMVYRFGWQADYDGQNIQRIMEV